MSLDPTIQDSILRAIPDLRAYALFLCRNRDHADDLVQDTLVRSIDHICTFKKGTDLKAWLFVILRNKFYDDLRQIRRAGKTADSRYVNELMVPPAQVDWCIAKDLVEALAKIPIKQREAVILVGAFGLNYDDAAATAGCQVGTMKSRVNRGRTLLAAFLSGKTSGARRRLLHKSFSTGIGGSRTRLPVP